MNKKQLKMLFNKIKILSFNIINNGNDLLKVFKVKVKG